MLVIPAIDLLDDTSRSYAGSVIETIREWERAGFSRIQLGTSERRLPDSRLLEDIVRDTQVAIQVVGAFNASEDVDAALAAGCQFVLLGSRAMDEMDWMSSVVGRFPGQLILATPARERRARSRGVMRTLPLDLRDVATEIAHLPLAALVVEFAPDAAIGHPELALIEDVVEEVDFPVQVTGGSPGLGTLRDLDFRGVGAVVMSAAVLSAEFDGQEIARNFTD